MLRSARVGIGPLMRQLALRARVTRLTSLAARGEVGGGGGRGQQRSRRSACAHPRMQGVGGGALVGWQGNRRRIFWALAAAHRCGGVGVS